MFRFRLLIKWTTDCLQLPLLLQQKRLHFQSYVFRNFFKRTRSYFIVGFETSFIQILFVFFFSFIYSNRFLPSLSTTWQKYAKHGSSWLTHSRRKTFDLKKHMVFFSTKEDSTSLSAQQDKPLLSSLNTCIFKKNFRYEFRLILQ